MSQQSPQSSAVGPSSSPFTGTDPTLYSPDMARGRRKQLRETNAIVVANGKQTLHDLLTKPEKRVTLAHPPPYKEGAFINEIAEDAHNFISRYMVISQLPDGTCAGTDFVHEFQSVQQPMKLYDCFSLAAAYCHRGVHLRFDDIRKATEGKDILEQHGFVVEYISGYQFAIVKGQDTASMNEFEGQMQLSIQLDPNTDMSAFSADDLHYIAGMVERICNTFGTVRSCVHVQTNDVKLILTFRVEFHSIEASHRAVYSLKYDAFWGCNAENTYKWSTTNPTLWSGERASNSPHRHQPRIDDKGRIVGYRQAPTIGNDNPRYHHPADQHNRVRRERILDGSDVRTTIMLRNIPNKVDRMALKVILDDACFGTYDFVYLRIDFANGNNVGYAFINFADVQGMIALIDKIEGRRWVGFKSEKAAEISYATIQGREALIQKFRNSSVMQETPYCRPRLFMTFVDAEVTGNLRATGTEQAMPRPDNLSKLQRSMDSARSNGLFPPQNGTSASEHRNRTSFYDRGTPRDMMQTAMPFAHQRAVAAQFHGFTEGQKRTVEFWYAQHYGVGAFGPIGFDSIPMVFLTQYLQQQQQHQSAMASNIGVIGGPAYVYSPPITVTTPTRAGRKYSGPSYNGYNRIAGFGNEHGSPHAHTHPRSRF